MMHLVSDWLVDTFVYTGALIGAVLLLRRPVSRYFGPQVAYALWALPLLRLAMPPLVLPAWMAPAAPPAGTGPVAGDPLVVLVTGSGPAAAAPELGFQPLDLLVPAWLIGAALFLAWRTHTYLTMRRELLAEARSVGEAGRIRLVETPAVASPLAFGVLDKVVALPPRFMAHPDREARDLAIAHELAHHGGHDLLANIAAQPLLALHWFNPLAWAGWRAMRRDQEAACDARVVAGRGRTARAVYASVIASVAAGDNRLALAAPMACRMRGEKSIIHRLRSLASSEVPTARRRAGLLAIGAAALGLPLTASISYAQPSVDEPPAPPEAPAAPQAPAGPQAPAAPQAPVAPPSIEAIDPDLRHRHDADERRDYTIVRRGAPQGEHGWPALDEIHDILDREFGRDFGARMDRHAMAEVERALAESEHALAEADHAMKHADRARREVPVHVQMAMRDMPHVSTNAQCDGSGPVIERELEDGREAIIICRDLVDHRAVDGLRAARRAIERNTHMPAERREELLDLLDEQTEQLSAERISVSLRYEVRPALAHAAVYATAALVRPTRQMQAAIADAEEEACAAPGVIA